MSIGRTPEFAPSRWFTDRDVRLELTNDQCLTPNDQ